MLGFLTNRKSKKHPEEENGKQKAEKGKDKEETAARVAKEEDAPVSTTPIIISKPDDAPSPEATPLLDDEDEKFLERLTSPQPSFEDDEGTPPPLPPRVKTPVFDLESNDGSSIASKEDESRTDKKGKGKENLAGKDEKNPSDSKPKRFSFVTNLSRSFSSRRSKPPNAAKTATKDGLEPDTSHLAVPSTSEARQEKDEMARVLDDLDLAAQNNRAFSLSAESAQMVRNFTQVLKDLVNGVPTAWGDLVKLLEDPDGVLAKNYEKLPKSLKKLVAQLPEKLTMSLAPELLVAAAEAQGLALSTEEAGDKKDGLKGAAKKFLTPSNLQQLVTKPGAIVGLLKGIVNALKARFPAFIGTNVLWSLAVFLLLSALWYCYKRGREVRLEQEASGVKEKESKTDEESGGRDGEEMIDGKPRVEELPDDPQLPAAGTSEGNAIPGISPGNDAAKEAVMASASNQGAEAK